MTRTCEHCGASFEGSSTGRPAAYCSTDCKDRARMRRRARKINAHRIARGLEPLRRKDGELP